MGKTGKWLKSFLTGKKIDKEHSTTNYQNQIISFASSENPSNSVPIPKEKKRWSFRRSSASAAKDSNPPESNVGTPPVMTMTFDIDMEQEKHAMAVAAATAAAVAAAQAAAAIIRMTAVVTASNGKHIIIEEAAAVKIQSVFRSYLARKALCALKGLVKLQAMVRGHLVRKRAADTLRCMQALVTAQTRARTQRIKMAEDSYSNSNPHNHWQSSIHRKSFQENRLRNPHQEIEREMEENIKIVEMDQGEASKKTRNTYKSSNQTENYNFSASPAPSALTEMSPISYSNHFEDYSNITSPHSHSHYYSSVSKPNPSHIPFEFPKSEYAESLPYDYPLNFPNYMANTESSKAKVRSQSAPKARPDAFERQPSRRRVSVEGRNIPRAVRMQRSSSHLGSSAGQRDLFMWPVKLDRSSVSLKDSECGSSCSVATNLNYCRSSIVAAHDAHGSRC